MMPRYALAWIAAGGVALAAVGGTTAGFAVAVPRLAPLMVAAAAAADTAIVVIVVALFRRGQRRRTRWPRRT